MISRSTLLLSLTFVALCAFSIGYWLGTEKTLIQLSSKNQESASSEVFPTPEIELAPVTIKNDANKSISPDIIVSKKDDDNAKITHISLNGQVDVLKLPANASVIEMMEFLFLVGASENIDNVKQFGPTLDKLKVIVSENPDKMQVLIDYFIDADAAAQAPYYITSVLQSANIEDNHIIINNMISRLSTQGTANANKKLLYLVSSIGAHHDNEQITNTLKSIALYSQDNSANRTYALNLLQPYQLNKDEKSKVVSELSFALDQTPSEDVSYMIENIIRFSDKVDRINLASNYLAESNDFATRVAVLSTMHNGTIKPNESLKATLFEIADNPNDPLNKHAKDTLMYVFEIDNNEYQRLQNGG